MLLATLTATSQPTRDDPPAARSVHPIVLFDGQCNLCSASVQWILRRDRRARFRFASLQSRAGSAAVAAAGHRGSIPDSLVLIDAARDRPRIRFRSSAVLGIASHLGFPWSLAVVGYVIPRVLRDAAYDFIARRRLRWFGSRATCWVPTKELRSRFLDAGQ
ncbi:MAG: thiol-disulfide oxidoreductase DCC family protein [Planctomycetota bacterium]